MKVSEVKKVAKNLGIRTTGAKKADIIRTIQKVEGNYPCYGTANDHCDQHGCCWREDCLPKR